MARQVLSTTPAADRRGYVLLVEDNDVDRRVFTLLLERSGCAVVTAANGQEALDYLRNHAPPCLILLDVKMPGMDGYHFRAVQQQDPSLAAIPVVMVTGMVAQDAHAHDAALVLAKPVSEERLLAAVQPYCASSG